MTDGLVTAFRTLSVLPVPGKDARDFSRSLYWFPFVGLVLGGIQSIGAWVGIQAGWPEVGAVLVLIAGLFLTRGIHADGVADLADGFFGGRDIASRLRIMKDSATGAFGVLALGSLLLFKWVVLVRLVQVGALNWIVAGCVCARLVQVLLASSMPYARNEGGTASDFVHGAGWRHMVTAAVTTAVLLVLLPGFSPLFLVVALAAALISAGGCAVLSYVKIRGVTGDVLGAASEFTELAVWLTGALFFTLL
ncbi:MAG TPA: adenosylcobinamide-GDP ribazoletransferase [Prosthecochloris aestuarii]|uniref:Adenosylcobinamide-GDP ribazoletransferase n=1 Tax=Prosthecochloris aestuarii TaxID=1102 RepID=A0A831WVM6_PROAE|nr:adenosylcobinamide-GDP ribazoletransferase [Prosthecochloris aestuarii]